MTFSISFIYKIIPLYKFISSTLPSRDHHRSFHGLLCSWEGIPRPWSELLFDRVFPGDEPHWSETSKNGRCCRIECKTGMEVLHDIQRHFHTRDTQHLWSDTRSFVSSNLFLLIEWSFQGVNLSSTAPLSCRPVEVLSFREHRCFFHSICTPTLPLSYSEKRDESFSTL